MHITILTVFCLLLLLISVPLMFQTGTVRRVGFGVGFGAFVMFLLLSTSEQASTTYPYTYFRNSVSFVSNEKRLEHRLELATTAQQKAFQQRNRYMPSGPRKNAVKTFLDRDGRGVILTGFVDGGGRMNVYLRDGVIIQRSCQGDYLPGCINKRWTPGALTKNPPRTAGMIPAVPLTNQEQQLQDSGDGLDSGDGAGSLMP